MSQSIDQAAIIELLPPLAEIRDGTLRDRVIKCWLESTRRGNAGRGWTTRQLRDLPFTLLAGRINLTFIEHVNSGSLQCIAIADVLSRIFGDRIPIDRDALIAGALLADVGKLIEIELDPAGSPRQSEHGRFVRHPFIGVALCEKFGLPPAVQHIVATHSHEGDRVQRSIESIIFHHADFIDFDIAKLLGGAR